MTRTQTLLLFSLSLLTACAAFKRVSPLSSDPPSYESIGREKGRTRAAAKAWFKAGVLWAGANPPAYQRALLCFQKVDAEKVGPDKAQQARIWIQTLKQLLKTQEALRQSESLRSALEDATEASRALRGNAK